MDVAHYANLAVKRAIYGRRGEPFDVAGATIRYVPGTRPVRPRYASSADVNVRHDALQVRLLSAQLDEGDTAIDVGAHAGQYSLLMAARCGRSGSVVSFEPDPYARAVLQRNVDLNPGIKPPTVEALALSDTSGRSVLYSNGGNSQSSLVRSAVDPEGTLHPEALGVDVTSLDDYLGLRPHRPRWVKIDVEGAEIRVLRGAGRLLASDAGILCELHPYAWPELGDSFRELEAIVARSGRRMRYIDRAEAIRGEPAYGIVIIERHA
jgi:FkbM family methyltransferase